MNNDFSTLPDNIKELVGITDAFQFNQQFQQEMSNVNTSAVYPTRSATNTDEASKTARDRRKLDNAIAHTLGALYPQSLSQATDDSSDMTRISLEEMEKANKLWHFITRDTPLEITDYDNSSEDDEIIHLTEADLQLPTASAATATVANSTESSASLQPSEDRVLFLLRQLSNITTLTVKQRDSNYFFNDIDNAKIESLASWLHSNRIHYAYTKDGIKIKLVEVDTLEKLLQQKTKANIHTTSATITSASAATPEPLTMPGSVPIATFFSHQFPPVRARSEPPQRKREHGEDESPRKK